MSKSGTAGGTVAVRPYRSGERPARDRQALLNADGTLPGSMEAAGLAALLVSDRSAAWLPWRRPAVRDDAQLPELPGEWDDRSGTQWTPDLVHCRLVEAGRILKRLPAPASPGRVGTVWRQLAPAESRGPAPAKWEIDLCWWTVDQLMELKGTDRLICFGFMLSLSTRRIEALMKEAAMAGVVAIARSRISQRYARTRTLLAARWNGASVRVDRGSFDLRQIMLERGFK